MSDPAERRIGTVIAGKWRVESLLGSGSMAAVFGVTHRNGARAALKILHPTLCTDQAVCERFLGEGYLTNSVKHPGIVRVLDDGMTDDGCVFLVMDLLEGKTLEALRQDRDGQIPLLELLDIADKLLDALRAVHEAGIIHRDLKPQNVFVCDDGSVKLLDFGVARVFDTSSQSKLSMFGLVLGTPSFMSPEQALGSRDKVDHRADIWSLGATLFTALSGQTVHLGPNVQAKLLAAATVQARSVAMVKQDLPLPLVAAIDTALRFKKEERWQTAEAMRRAFRDARLQLGLGKPQSIPPPGFDLDDTQLAHHEEPGEPIAVHSNDSLFAKPNGMTTPNKPRSVPPPADGFRHGPAGTFIGIGTVGSALAGGAVHELPAGSRNLPNRGTLPQLPVAQRFVPPTGDADATGPRAPLISTPGAFVPSRGSRPDGTTEGSYPAVGSTLKLDDSDGLLSQVGNTRRSGAGVWVAGFALALAAVGGVAFFAVNRASAEDGKAQESGRAAQGTSGPSATSAQAPLTSATATIGSHVMPTPEVAPPSTAETAQATAKDASSAIDPSLKSTAATAASQARTAHAAQPPVVRPQRPPARPAPTTQPTPRPPATQDPAPAVTPTATPAPTPTLAPDPFGTPE